MRIVTSCGVCESSTLESLWDLPRLPLTERFGPYSPAAELAFDQTLAMCGSCGHVQLRNQLDPATLYTPSTYSFRTGASQSAQRGTAIFLDFINSVSPDRRFTTVLDVGGNDLHLARQLLDIPNRVVIDPICAPEDGKIVDGITIVGRMVETVDIRNIARGADLVTCRHTLEHIAKPRALLQQLFAQCSADALYVFEIPDFESLVEAQRFDAVFHQHYHYFDLAAFRRLITEVGGEYLGHYHNYQGSCGGALLIAFRKAPRAATAARLDLDQRRRHAMQRIALYKNQMRICSQLLEEAPKPAYGYGASLMLATLGYHLGTNFSSLECILDDAPDKDGATYENVPVTVRYTGAHAPPENATFLVTSLENVRPISARASTFKPRRVLVPIII